MPNFFLQGMTNSFGFAFSVKWHYKFGLQLELSKANKVGDTKSNI